MMVRIVEVHFNHDPDAHHSDALNLRRHGGEPALVEAPEWTADGRSDPAAYVSSTLRNPVTVKARFDEGPADEVLRIRAIDAYRTPSKPSGCEPDGCARWLEYLGGVVARALEGSLLGYVREQEVAFDSEGRSGLVELELEDHLLGYGAVIVRDNMWRWQYQSDGSWQDFDTTEHRIYVIPEPPMTPWQQAPYEEANTQLPWVTALDVACSWAVFAGSREDIAQRITNHVNRIPHFSYDGSSAFTLPSSFMLGYFLATLGNTERPFSLNCTDCAHAVTTLANLLGCHLAAGEIGSVDDRTFATRPILALGSPPVHESWRTRRWDYHEVAWWGGDIGVHGLVYDAALQVDMDDEESDRIHEARLPAGMVYGALGSDDYHFRLMGEQVVDFGSGPSRLPVY